MGKHTPKLKLVSRDEAGSVERGLGISGGLDFRAFEELSSVESKRVRRLLESVCSRAGIIAVARTMQPWDVRPVLVLSDEEGPSLIRLAGPDVSVCENVSVKLHQSFERVARFKKRSSELRDWGTFEDQLWFRRTLVSNTLAHLISGEAEIDYVQMFSLIELLVEELSDWHSHGIVHGHLSTTNISLNSAKEPILLDPCIGAATAQAMRETSGNSEQTFAPEILSDGVLDYRSDVFGLGQVIRRLFLALRKKYQYSEESSAVEKRIQPFLPILNTMIDSSPDARPSLEEVRRVFAQSKKREKPAMGSGKKHNSASSGRILSRSAGSLSTDEGRSLENVPSAETEDNSFFREDPDETGGEEELFEESAFSVEPSLGEEFVGVASQEQWFDDEESSQTENEEDFVNFDQSIGKPVRKTRRPNARSGRAKARRVVGETSVEPGGISFGTFVAGLCLVLACIWLYFRGLPGGEEQTQIYDPEELKIAWESKRPSSMQRVAEMALVQGQDYNFAEALIVRSANNGDSLPSAVNIALLRVAFHSKWEMELSDEDRRMALALGLAGLLREKMPRDLGELGERHPGVIFAVTASAGPNVNKILRDIPASVLGELPPPYGPAFFRIAGGKPGVSCASPEVQILSHLATRGIEKGYDIPRFLEQDTLERLQSLALLYSTNNEMARQLLNVLLAHPNIVLDHEQIRWARESELLSWSEIEASDQLFVLAGIPPVNSVGAKNIGKMFMHPVPAMRKYAVDQAVDVIKFAHPGAYEALRMLSKKPELLSPVQLLELAELLENPERASAERIKKWISSEPPVKLVSALVLAALKPGSATKLDTWFVLYLRSKGWQPDVVALRDLSSHPDKYIRLFAYTKIYEMKDREAARTFLKSALSNETIEDYRRQLELMIEQLKIVS